MDRESDLSIPVGAVVRAWRQHRGWSLTELAEVAGPPITKGYLSQLERGLIKQPRSRQKLDQIARALGVSGWDLHARHMPGENLESPDPPAPETIVTSGVLGSPIPSTREETRGWRRSAFGQQLEALIAEFNLPYADRKRCERMILETARAICRVSKEDEG
jgi:transcriptional regulator with XRE-family HTH domain